MIRYGVHKGKPYRPTQQQAIKFIQNSKKKFIAINMPTGGGKSIVGIEALEHPIYYLCSSRQLQQQICRDFPRDAKMVWGKKHYRCALGVFENVEKCSVDMKTGEEKQFKCDIKEIACEYYLARKQAFEASITVLNYHYFLALANYTNFPVHPRPIVCDEADVLEPLLTDWVGITIGRPKLKKLGIDLWPAKKTVPSSMLEFLDKLYTEIKKLINITTSPELLSDLYKLLHKIANIFKHIEKSNTQWIYKSSDTSLRFVPKWLSYELCHEHFFSFAGKHPILFMSATLPSYQVFARLFSISFADLDYAEFPSEFMPEKRPVIFEPKWKLTRSAKPDRELIRQEVRKLLEVEREKGLIHTVSYQLANILADPPLSPRLIFHNAHDREQKFKQFLKSKDGVFVSPSSIRGIDLPDDLTRWILFLKTPFADLSDPLVSARAYSGKWGNTWYKSIAVQDIVQGAGRGCRHKDDWVRVYVWDATGKDLITKNPSLFPAWFREAVEIK